MADDRWTPPPWLQSPRPSTGSFRQRRGDLIDSERLLALEMTDDHHDELHRQTAHRLEMGDHRMDHIETRIDRVRQDQRDAAQRDRDREKARAEREEARAAARKARNEAIQMAVWIMALLVGSITVWNFLSPRPPPAVSEISVPARR